MSFGLEFPIALSQMTEIAQQGIEHPVGNLPRDLRVRRRSESVIEIAERQIEEAISAVVDAQNI